MSQASSGKVLFAVDGINMVTHTWPRWEERETAEISVLKQTYLPHTFQAQGPL